MDTAHWPQEIVVKPMEELIAPNPNIISDNKKSSCSSSTSLERKVRPQKEQALNCPRCKSTNTKFCYYNNYSLSQPRYFCKTCKRYWTEGGSLRNIPVGGGSRKNKKPSFSTNLSSKISTDLIASQAQTLLNSNPKIFPNHHHLHQGQDLNLGFPQNQNHDHTHDQFRSLSEFIQLPTIENPSKTQIPNSGPNSLDNSANLSALELLNGFTSSRGLAQFSPIPIGAANHTPNHVVYSSGFPLNDHHFKPNTLNFTLDGIPNHGYGNLQGGVDQQEGTNNGRILFSFEDLKPISSNTSTDLDYKNTITTTTTTSVGGANNELNREQGNNSTGYWTGLLGSGASW